MRVLVDVLSERCERIGLGVPEAAAYNEQWYLSLVSKWGGSEGKQSAGQDLPTKQEPGWRWT